MTGQTLTLHRVFKAQPSRIYRAFLTPQALVKWLPPHGFVGEVHQMEAVVGGAWRMSFINLGTGHGHAFGGTYLELVPDQRLVYTSAFDDPHLPGTMRTTVRLQPVSCGTDVSVVQEGIPAVIPLEACCVGWQESLSLLAPLVEAVIPG